MLSIFEWGHVPGTDVQSSCWGRYCTFVRRRSGTGNWSVELWHLGKRIRHEEHPSGLTPTEARGIAEGFLLDAQGPMQRELVRRMRAAQSASASTRQLRAAGKRRHAIAEPRWARSSKIQSLLFRTDAWTVDGAKAWAAAHEFRYGDVHVTAGYVRLRQRDPDTFKAGHLRTMSFGKTTGIKAIVGEPRRQRRSDEGTPTRRDMEHKRAHGGLTDTLRARRLRRMARGL